MIRLIAISVLALGVVAAGAAKAEDFTLTSPDVTEGGTVKTENVFKGGGCAGNNVSPVLHWSGAPSGTKSFAVTVFDPDAPTGSGFWHWVIFDIPPTVTSLPSNAGNPTSHLAPKGSIQVRNDYGTIGYGGPCPPPGPAHHYVFTVFAVDTAKLAAKADSTPAIVGFNLHFHTVGKATLTGLYGH